METRFIGGVKYVVGTWKCTKIAKWIEINVCWNLILEFLLIFVMWLMRIMFLSCLKASNNDVSDIWKDKLFTTYNEPLVQVDELCYFDKFTKIIASKVLNKMGFYSNGLGVSREGI